MGDEVVIKKAGEALEEEKEEQKPVEQKAAEDTVEAAVEQKDTGAEPVDEGAVKPKDVEAELADEVVGTNATAENKDNKTEFKGYAGPPNSKKKFRDNIKFDPSLLPESDDPAEIKKQVEFYFSESNLPFDKFLFGLVGKENRAVPLKLICSFKRMRRFTNQETVLSALRDSDVVALAGEPGSETIRRMNPIVINEVQEKADDKKKASEGAANQGIIPRQAWDADLTGGRRFEDPTIPRSIYAKGFGDETPTTQIDLENFFAPHGPIASVRLRRTGTGHFKSSIFVEFKEEELMEKFMELEEKPKWNGTELIWLTKKAYCDGKIQDIKDGKIQPKFQTSRNNSNHKSGDRGHKNNHQKGKGGKFSRESRSGGRRGGNNNRRGNGMDNKNRNGPPKLKTAPAPVDGVPKLETKGNTEPPATSGGADNKRKAEDHIEVKTGAKKVKQELGTA